MVVALAREAGIPARLVGTVWKRSQLLPNGAAKGGWHRWAQVYFPGYGWVRVDATPRGPSDIVDFNDVNGDGVYDTCDLCTSPAQCADCGLADGFDNPNDRDDDGDVDGDDVAEMVDSYLQEDPGYLDRGFANGVKTKDLITYVTPGLSLDEDVDSLRLHYTSNDVPKGSGKPDRWWSWSNCFEIVDVIFDKSEVFWRLRGHFDAHDLVRIDLYRLQGSSARPRYRFVKNLKLDVPALAGRHPVDLGGLSSAGKHVVVVTRQDRPAELRLSALPSADWETFGASRPFRLPVSSAGS